MTQDVPQGFAAAAADFEAMARRFWDAWADTMRQVPNPGMPPQASTPFGAPGFVPGMGVAGAGGPGLGGAGSLGMSGLPGGGYGGSADPFAWWAQHVQGPAAAQDVAGRFDALARHWYAQMQQLAAHFAGRDNSAADVTEAWRQLLQAGGGNPFAQLLAMAQRQPGSFGPDAWMGQAAPWLQSLQALRGQAHDWLRMPAFGVAREHQERWQVLVSAQIALQEKLEAYGALMGRVLEDALQRFERKLAEREAPGLGIEAPRALFDLWIDAAEEAYAPVALGPEFRRVYGELVDAQMRVRQSVQREVEQVCALFDMPTRTELDGAHRKIVELERQVRRLRDAVARMPDAAGRASSQRRARPVVSRPGEAPTAATGTVRGGAPDARRPDASSARADAPRKKGRASAARKRPQAGQSERGGARIASTPADAPTGSRVASQDDGAQAAPATRIAATKKKASAPRRSDAQAARRPAGQRPGATASKTSKPEKPAPRATRKAASPPMRRGQPALFSPTDAMPAAPQPLKAGKGKGKR